MFVKVIFTLIGLATLSFGFCTMFEGARFALEARASATWPAAPGHIVASHVKRSVSHGRHGSSTSYTPEINYTYLVAGKTYTGTVVTPGRNWGSKSSFAAVNAHPAGSTAPVYYSPGDPSVALLEPGLHASNFGRLLLGMVLATFGSIFALVGTYSVRSPGKNSMSLPPHTVPTRLILPLFGLLAAEVAALIWLS